MLNPRILRGLILIPWLVTAPANVKAQNSRASSAASYLERGAKPSETTGGATKLTDRRIERITKRCGAESVPRAVASALP